MSHRTARSVRGRVGTWVPLAALDGEAATEARNAKHYRVRGRGRHRVVAVSDVDTSSLARRAVRPYTFHTGGDLRPRCVSCGSLGPLHLPGCFRRRL